MNKKGFLFFEFIGIMAIGSLITLAVQSKNKKYQDTAIMYPIHNTDYSCFKEKLFKDQWDNCLQQLELKILSCDN